ncbi:glycerol kinase GlpK [Flavihumibacter cheonanensis]|jgi:glycerol kinase|uniref:glycerol kinase GlpK n=1 Tax=Flavihumibacter cheonanensis TaxID=1442385 RepID=UPI001EF79F61|nr:glycerol kinase GlpK [Flavihumibacter cheonanensis]MCG7754069.1 glycerol kinase GlpK [Flavihumibacter cheonanensis]
MPEKYILSLDQGTTSSRAILFDKYGQICHIAQKEFTQLYPQPGWVEHDAEEIWATQFSVMAEAIAKASLTTADIAAIGITNQRETTVVWDRTSSKPIYNAIVWQDRRTAGYCDQLKADGLAPLIQTKTGLVIDAYFSATKLKWILDNVSGAREKAVKGELAFGTIDCWLNWKLTNGKVHATDVSNASRTMLMNLETCEWDEELLKLFDIPASVLPEIIPSSKIYGVTESVVKNANIPLAGIAGDQQAALFGQQCTTPGMVKNTYGTGCFMLMHTGDKIVHSSNKLLTTVAWKLNNRVEYAVEGSIFIGGAVVQWLRDGLHMIRSSAEIEDLASRVTDTDGVYIVPAFAGLGAPHWNQHARGTVFGLTRGTTRAHIARACLESIAYQTMDVLKAMEADAGLPIKELRVDGGATINNLLMQFQCDLLQVPVIRPEVYETTALGAAYLAGLGVGYWESTADIQQQWKAAKEFHPQRTTEEMRSFTRGWERAIKASIAWADER